MSTNIEHDNCWSWTNSGKRMYYNNPQPDMVRFEDIACSLSKTCRFAGQIDEFYSVADHCCNLVEHWNQVVYVSDLTGKGDIPFRGPEISLYFLLHDAAEAYMGDCPAPAKWTMPQYIEVEKRIFNNAIVPYFNLSTDSFVRSQVKFYDQNIIRNEAELLFKTAPDWTEQYADLGATIKVSRDHKEARERFTAMYIQLTAQRNGLGQ